MSRPSRAAERRLELLPVVARTFADLGYRRATTAELAGRCGIRENVLYRLWPDKKAMFLATLDFAFDLARGAWDRVLEADGEEAGGALRLLEYEGTHHGEFGLHRIVFAGLSETDDPDIRAALARMYGRFHSFISERMAAHRETGDGRVPDVELAAWAVVGLGTVLNIGAELDLIPAARRVRLMTEVGAYLLEGRPE